ncbi:MAG: hypothetical protein ACLT69_12760 [Intestinibacter bartlettii]
MISILCVLILITYHRIHIFTGTIEDNLRLGNRSNVTDEDILMACKIAMIDTDIAKMPLQLKTKLDEKC